MNHYDLTTSEGGRAYVAEYFALYLRRHDFTRYIHDRLAADFACALAQYLHEDQFVARRISETLAEVYATIIGDDAREADESLNMIERAKKAAQVLRLEVDLYRSLADGAAQEPTNKVVVARMGYGTVAVGSCLAVDTGEPGIIYMALDEPGEIGRDTTGVYPIGSRPAADRVLAYVSFKTSAAVDQTIGILNELKAQYFGAPAEQMAPPSGEQG